MVSKEEDVKDPFSGPPSPQEDEFVIGDNPPAYDAVATEPFYSSAGAGSSSGAQADAIRLPPKDTLYLFSGPRNVENLLGRLETPEAVLNSIEFTESNGMIYSADRRLQNGTTLYDWVRRQALVHPSLRIRCQGVHFDKIRGTEFVNDANDVRQTKGQTERIVDFDFTIDLAPVFAHPDNLGNVHIAIARPDQPVLRGTPSPAVAGDYSPNEHDRDANGYQSIQGPLDSGRVAWKNEIKAYRDWEKWRVGRGLPPWVRPEDVPAYLHREQGKGKGSKGVALPINDEAVDVGAEERTVGASSAEVVEASLREWCNKYAADNAYLKEFWVPKDFWGWDLEGLKTAIKGAITSTGYTSNFLTVEIEPAYTGLVVRPNNWLSKMVNNSFVFFLLWITFIYPFIWLWQHLHSRGGGPYRVATINYAFKFYPPLPSTFPGETLEQAQSRLGGMYKIHPELPKPTTLVPGPKGIHYLLGRKEGEWFREWEERIRMGVRMRFKGDLIGGGEEAAGTHLDGY